MKTTKTLWIILILYFIVMCVSLTFNACTKNRDPITTTGMERSDGYVTDKDIEDLQREQTDSTDLTFTKGELRGMKLFMTHCNRCHPAGQKGKGPSLVDKKLPDFLIHFQIRNGLGDMPAFKEEDISKADVKRIILFVKLLRESEAD
ncbi:MAG: cytochrome c [Bacteroidia bacterium]|nr:cytochrome c [Bacteroidia bacterium]